MAKPILISLSLCILVLVGGCSARHQRQQSRQQRYGEGGRQEQYGEQCQIDRLDALEPTKRIEAEAGVIETWDPNHEQFQCAGVAVSRVTIEPNGLLLPSYSNSPKLVYIVRGRGFQGTIIPGCPETYQESQRSQQGREGSSRSGQDQHQTIRHYREGDIYAVPSGAAHWCYNDGDSPVVAVILHDTSNFANQLDQYPRKFYLAGNPDEEFEQQQGRGREKIHRRGQQGSSSNNVFRGFDESFLAEVFNVDTETARRLQGQDDNRRNIIRVRDRLDVIRPPRSREERERGEGEEREWEREGRRRGRANGFEETICSLRLKENIGDPSRADVYTPEAGRISTLNSHNLPVLSLLQLSAERGFLYSNAIYVPHWNLNAHSVIYGIRGSARVQVVDNNGQSVYNGELRQGQLLTVPQSFALVKQASDEGFEWISFKTNDNAMISPLAGRTSAIRALPIQVLANAYQISPEEARRIKFNREETTLLSPRRPSGRRAEA